MLPLAAHALLAAGIAMIPAASLFAQEPVPAGSIQPPEIGVVPPTGFSALFNGQDLTGWRGRPHLDPRIEGSWSEAERVEKQAAWDAEVAQHWSVENGELVNDGHGAYLTTLEDFGDFELLLDYKTVAQADSGIYLRNNPQVQIWDTTEAGGKWNIGADKGSGGLWNNQSHANRPLAHADKPFGEWNTLRIVMIGEKLTIWLNEQKTVEWTTMENYFDRSAPLFARGPVQLQTHGGEIRFRNLFVRRIGADEANWMLSSRDAEGFQPVFNGLDFTGWSGPTHNYVVEQGTIRCKAGAGGTIYTNQEYADFEARLEFRLPPGGNNGLAIRYPGKGDTAYVGMCELQVLDNTAEKYAGLAEYQFHGSVYGQKAAHRGFLRPVGAWNFQQVRVQGSRITVELNGTVILDQDISEIEKPPSGHEHPGRTRTSGHFGFAGHNDPVAFREVQIRALPVPQ
jgi:3-keto-disaccharide hydrolase